MNGIVFIDDEKHKFNFVDNILTIFPIDYVEKEQQWHNYFDLFSKPEFLEDNLYGKDELDRDIQFLELKLNKYSDGYYRGWVPAYIISDISGNSTNIKYKSMKIYGEFIDILFTYNIIKNHDKDFTKIELFNVNELQKHFTLNSCSLTFGIKEYLGDENNAIISKKNYLEVTFNEPLYIEDILKIYNTINRCFGVILHRKTIIIEKIELFGENFLKIASDKEIQNKHHLFIAQKKDEMDLDLKHNHIVLNDIECNFEQLFNEIEENDMFSQGLKNKEADYHSISICDYLNMASMFESEFGRVFPDYKTKTSENFKIVKNEIIEFINNKIASENKNKKYKDYYKNFERMVEMENGTLSEKINYCFKLYKEIIDSDKIYYEEVYNLSELKYSIIANEFAHKRNDIAHGNELKPFTDVQLIAYRLVEKVSYCLLLQKAGFELDKINEIVNKIL